MNLEVGLSGHFIMEAVDECGNRRRLAEFDNLILDAGLEQMGKGSYLTDCRVGSGSSTPIVSQTALDNKIASTQTLQATNYGAQGSAPYYGWYIRTFRFAQGAAAGNLSEVGVGWNNTNNIATATSLFSRALILDTGGNPTTITVLANEFLDVTYELRLYPPTTDATSVINVNGTDVTVTGRAAIVTNSNWGSQLGSQFYLQSNPGFATIYSGLIGLTPSSPSGSGAGASACSLDAYLANSRKVTGSYIFGLNQNVIGGLISSVYLQFVGGSSWQFGFNPPLAKDNTKSLTIAFSVSWSRRNAP
ncbi:hypothetical protein [Aquirhabdus parva]|uniref:Uncharacterized protein n=1 Tax=Aquirhabdus parva TaxID=2283318 RepID=A0A345P999_9GAMM|nr:hypothetical protein [Aquirhabdus parva]AXI03858.1 hypothetical protein HYN46_14040 [Aquirhabdus parva]